MKNAVHLNGIKLVNADSLVFIKALPDNCIDLILTDPPYYKVKTHAWDNQLKKRPSSRHGDMIADFFLGGGNSLLAARQLGRKGIGVELETERFQSTVERLKK